MKTISDVCSDSKISRSHSSEIEFFSTPKSARSRVFRRSGTLCNKTLFRSPLFERNRFFLYSQESSLEYFGDLAPYAIKHCFEVIFILDLGQEGALVQCFSYLASKGKLLIITLAVSHNSIKQDYILKAFFPIVKICNNRMLKKFN